jgi:hypothetical protein
VGVAGPNTIAGELGAALPTPVRLRPWAALVDAVDVTVGQPTLWLFGALGFLLRGGLLLLLVPLIALPSPVEVRLLIGDGLGSTGFSGGLMTTAAAVGAIVAAVLLGAMLVLACLELWTFERTRGPELPARLVGGARRHLVSWLFTAQALALLLIAAATLPLIAHATAVTYKEILLPGGPEPLYLRVLDAVQPQLVVLGVAVVAAELLSAVATRTILGRAFGVPVAIHRRRWRPLVALVGWTVSLGVLAPLLWTLATTSRWVRATLLDSTGAGGEPAAPVLAVTLLVAVWAATLALAGFASALRGALWSMQELR